MSGNARVTATDVSAEAVETAGANAEELRARGESSSRASMFGAAGRSAGSI